MNELISRFVGRKRRNEFITVVSGLPRSGTSMMMQMLEAGGMPIVMDGIREADRDNPRGYREFQKAKQIEKDIAWLKDCRGRALKMVSALLYHLPAEHSYKVIFMERKMEEILASQRAMLERLEEAVDDVSDAEMAQRFERHLSKIRAWLKQQRNIEVLYANYNAIIAEPRSGAAELNRFLGGRFDAERMVLIVERILYRQRK